ncbi:MAG: AAA family ATPase [Streptosporangiales bacterium]|nr:AAA family ATPase [Streptosporangiales bacterium]
MAPPAGSGAVRRSGGVLLKGYSWPVAFIGGKGGVGKTTLAAAYALLCAGRGERTLVVSTDPAHSLGDVLAEDLGERPRLVDGSLWAAEISGADALDRRVAQVYEDAAEALPRDVLPAVRRHLAHAASSPGMVESALADRLAELLGAVPGEWERLVVDSAPTGHLLRMLNLPALLTPWVEGLVRQRERTRGVDRMLAGLAGRNDEKPDPLLERLRARRARLAETERRLREDATVHLVLLPERVPLAETVRAAEQLTAAGMCLGRLVVNRVVPSWEGGLLAARRTHQDEVLARARDHFVGLGMVQVPLMPGELTTRGELAGISEILRHDGW